MRAGTGPIRNSYWVTADRLMAGPYPGSLEKKNARRKVRDLVEAGVTFFLDLTEEDELAPYSQFLQHETGRNDLAPEYRRMPIQDYSVPTHSGMKETLDTIDDALEAGHTVYVHCWGGIGRTGTVVGCYLARHGTCGRLALSEIARLRGPIGRRVRRSPESTAQLDMVVRWPEGS